MGYEHIIEARKRLHGLGQVPHLFGGGGYFDGVSSWGDAGKAALGVASGGVTELIPGLSNFNKGQGPLGNNGIFSGNPFKKAGLQNNFAAQAPDFTKTDFSGGIGTGSSDYAAGQAGLSSAISGLDPIAQSQISSARGMNSDVTNTRALAGPGGLGGVLTGQQGLAAALADQAAGRGPNPAQEQFKQNLDTAIAQNTGMIASQKGINPALAARLASQNQAQMTQQAAGNAAQLQAQQQLAAQHELGTTLGQEGQTVMGQGQIYGSASDILGRQAGAYGQAGQTVMGQGALANDQTSQANTFYGTNIGGQNAQNNTGVNASLGTQGINAGVAQGNAQTRGQVIGGILNAGGTLGAAAIARGGSGGGGGGDGQAHGGMAGVGGNPVAPGVDHKAMALAHALMALGGQVPGHPAHPGNDPRNDVVPTVLSKGEIVLPNSVTQGPDASAKAADFVEKLKAKAHPGYGAVLQARRKLKEAEKACMGGAAA